LWQISDLLPEYKVDAAVGMSIAQMNDGSIGTALLPVIDACSQVFKSALASNVIVSNRFERNGVVLSELMRSELEKHGIAGWKIVTPNAERNRSVHNTYTEAEYALEQCKKLGYKSLFVIANHIHMRRVLGAYRLVMRRQGYKVTLYHMNVGFRSYGSKASCQPSFLHSCLFLAHEIFLGLPISIIRGWWKPWQS
jgi:uncharacterized SAM-binding protein YcdF (DUF218 family)